MMGNYECLMMNAAAVPNDELRMLNAELKDASIHNSSLIIHNSPKALAAVPNDELRMLNAEWLFSLTHNSSFIIHNSPTVLRIHNSSKAQRDWGSGMINHKKHKTHEKWGRSESCGFSILNRSNSTGLEHNLACGNGARGNQA